MKKQCYRCHILKPLTKFYPHSGMKDGRLGKCAECSKKDNKISNGTYKRICVICKQQFNTTLSEIKRGGGNCCSRKCFFEKQKRDVPQDEKSPNWKGDKVSKIGLHYWVKKHLGKPDICEHCGKTGLKGIQIQWANKSWNYKRELTDWLRLCVKCHRKYDGIEKWKKTMQLRYNYKFKN